MTRHGFSRSVHRVVLSVALGVFCAACAGRVAEAPPSPIPSQASPDRQLIKGASQSVVVETVQSAKTRVEAIVTERGGYVEESTAMKDEQAWLRCRVPASELDQVLDEIATTGEETNRSISTSDVTEALADDEARLRTQRALRERLTALLARAKNVEEVLAIEKELGRLQTEIEALERRLETVRSQVAFSSIDVSLERRRVLGPLGLVGKGIWSGVGKLFVIR